MSKTYTIYDNQGLLHDGLRKILNDNNFITVSKNPSIFIINLKLMKLANTFLMNRLISYLFIFSSSYLLFFLSYLLLILSLLILSSFYINFV